jgi:hypothetical protein
MDLEHGDMLEVERRVVRVDHHQVVGYSETDSTDNGDARKDSPSETFFGNTDWTDWPGASLTMPVPAGTDATLLIEFSAP